MFTIINLFLIVIGLLPLFFTLTKFNKIDNKKFYSRIKRNIIYIFADILFIICYSVFLNYYSEYLWFNVLNFTGRFWTVFNTIILLFFAGFIFSFIFLFLLLKLAYLKTEFKNTSFIIIIISSILSIFLGVSLGYIWQNYLLFMNQSSSALRDPVFNMPASFYLFSLPFLTDLSGWFYFLVFLSFAGLLLSFPLLIISNIFYNARVFEKKIFKYTGIKKAIIFLISITFFLIAYSTWLHIFKLMYSTEGVVSGAGFLDVYFRQPGLIVSIFLYAALGLIFLISAINRNLYNLFVPDPFKLKKIVWVPAIIIIGIIMLANWIIPAVADSTIVKPNEISLEKPFLSNSIKFARNAYKINRESIEEKEIPAGQVINSEIANANIKNLNNIRLWDWRALMDNLKEQQEIRLYYTFNDVDIDRYNIDGDYVQTMLSVREIDKDNLDPVSKTWISLKLIYTHGYGLVLLPVHKFLSQGKPDFYIQNIPAQISANSLKITRPEVYYGELTKDHVYVITNEKEFDYPSGQDNVYTTYAGKGGVPMDSFLKKLAISWKFDGYRLFFSSYFNKKSRVMFNRNIIDRARAITPFLRFDNDPYAVLTDDGRIKYFIDAYTVSDNYPYSQNYGGILNKYHGINYIRNSVKIVIDAYDGTVDYYIADKDDPIINTYKKIFPGLFHSMNEMPEGLKRHIRYPSDYLTIQAEMYSTYHMTDPNVFYQREDVWDFATERYRDNFQLVEPYYVLQSLSGEKNLQMILMIPFTPKNKNVMNAWMAGHCDFPDYGKITVYTFPKGIEVLGPRQIEARIDQNTEMSESLTLWGQRGSSVIRGNLLVIPLFLNGKMSILYVEPIFLQAVDAKLPEMKRIVVGDQERVVWSDSFDKALSLLTGETVNTENTMPTPNLLNENVNAMIKNAVQYFTNYENELVKGNFENAGKQLDMLKKALNDLKDKIKQ